MTTGGGKLAEEIQEEFLTCKICLEGYKNPKCLNCLHTFCEECIENHAMSESTYKKYSDYREFCCPLCRKRTQLPVGGVKKLPDNFLVSSLSETVGRQRPSKFPFCDICKLVTRKHKEAQSKCLDCSKLLCKQCVEQHRETKVTKNHSIFDVEIEKDIECKEHPEEVVRFYCEPCETCVCVLCTFNEHKDHDIAQFGDAVAKYKSSIEVLLANCKGKLGQFEKQLEALNKCDTLLKQAEQKIRDVSIDFISEIRSKEKALVEELHVLYGPQIMEYIDRKSEMTSNLDGLKSTCTLAELILKGKDIELLLLKKQVSEKLSALSELDFKALPPNVTKQIQFIPGTLDMGYIQDMDRPLSSKLRNRRAMTTSLDIRENPEPNLTTQETQTNPEMTCPPNAEKTTMTERLRTFDKVINTQSPEYYEKGCQTDFVAQNGVTDSESSSVSRRSKRTSASSPGADNMAANGSIDGPDSSPRTSRRHRRRRERAKVVASAVDEEDRLLGSRSYSPASARLARSARVYSSVEDNFYSADDPVSPK